MAKSKKTPRKRGNRYKGVRRGLLLRVPVSIDDVLREFSNIVGVTKNDFIVGVLEEAIPHLKSIIEAAKQVKKDSGAGSMRLLSAALNNAISSMQTQAGQAQYELGLLEAGNGKKASARST